ncbi:hypothetical protein LX87_04573 [Larkinella arboricola]|uniref:Uncharacterized protein n=1 Tax=Larkinella arboricola TaxID=643671 RepID=A0A327WMZ8_LARAB|nr:hypothetical protein LX87_04573 [Larkinella arboricola]
MIASNPNECFVLAGGVATPRLWLKGLKTMPEEAYANDEHETNLEGG